MNDKKDASLSGDSIMTVHDLAVYFRLSEAKVYKLANEGKIPALRVGKSWRFRRDLIDEWFRRQTELTLK
jgi:excisionase family DNA binding protein